ncbi:chorismate mutase [Candidatus Woesearchaeota archaeon]|nr:MAG: chorismate mutase [archaeon GW2011_AR4]MBS3129342.1 chorismate mutase [Candidatus Woesearchaeota archaeon]HIH38645.1 chorismate mutase [Candidatus Woesearchaeota archaeon]HIH49415.1 chorismate mutase [Candidatus Woesearchaeota archaeon]HIJ02849.1 chorismate mutase [Candidatus Woesearchaeota archaeon]
MESTNPLLGFRREIDLIDHGIVDLLAQRKDIVRQVAEYKAGNGIQRCHPERERQVIVGIREYASSVGVDPDVAQAIIERIIEYAHRVEQEYID